MMSQDSKLALGESPSLEELLFLFLGSLMTLKQAVTLLSIAPRDLFPPEWFLLGIPLPSHASEDLRFHERVSAPLDALKCLCSSSASHSVPLDRVYCFFVIDHGLFHPTVEVQVVIPQVLTFWTNPLQRLSHILPEVTRFGLLDNLLSQLFLALKIV